MTQFALQNFSKIRAAIERGSFQSVDEFTQDLMATGADEEGGDSYGAMKDGAVDKPVMPFGKAVTRNRGKIPVTLEMEK